MHSYTLHTVVATGVAGLLHGVSLAGAEFYEDLQEWEAAVPDAATFPFTPGNVALAEEVLTAPNALDDLDTKTLSFHGGNTGLFFDFTLQTLSWFDGQRYDWLYNTHLDLFPKEDHLNIGGKGNFDDDDFQMIFSGCENVFAVGINLLSNGSGPDTLSVYGRCGELLGTFDVPVCANDCVDFIGVTAQEPIGRIVFDEDSGSDDIFLGTLMFGSTCPLDRDVDGSVGMAEILEILSNWGPCPEE